MYNCMYVYVMGVVLNVGLIWLSGSVEPSNINIFDRWNCLDISTGAMSSTKGKSEKQLSAFFLIGVGTPGIRRTMASIS